ncbi:hypothetical protein A3A74_04740 [Candidatus Roizmanbacteria bacterium RIFCSPLOWO2_01_FULL_35_13]|uniref:Uncharacterized protein n=1 Tax=Candidatus Roizmanbacteria bacterium RIFCSPLOWO2_01_FULL_35_13 TaxID=1802055 RepID=A0A1F7IF39_9BACT|nr:MAG: hypothetical protein A3A74_04740 [Candidatus Roizmanbacteria bacterium RIFCSPLOWO2_01_FULL_35_13]
MEKFSKFARIAEVEFSDIVLSTHNLDIKLRIYLKDKSFIDFYFTIKLKTQRFSIHWERNHVDGSIYRVDNTPDRKWKKVESFPLHFHDKTDDKVKGSPFRLRRNFSLQEIFREFLNFVRKKII